MDTKSYDLGMVGLGVMGRNLLLNIADHGYSAFGIDRDLSQVEALTSEGAGKAVGGTDQMGVFVSHLAKPRVIILLVPAGPVVDSVIRELLPLISPGDLIIDAGNSHFKDTDQRSKSLSEKNIHFFGMGVSGGELGARLGPSMMPGGPKESFERVRPILEAVSAKVDGEPCVTYLGPGSAGHYVKMVHNGIEYGLMQLIAESYDLMHRGLGLTDHELHQIYEEWNVTELNSYLIEITSHIFLKPDTKTGKPLVDVILDVARQKGTGKWTSQDAMDLQVPVPTIDAAVAMRDLSTYETERANAARLSNEPVRPFSGDPKVFLPQLKDALYAAMIVTFAQGMSLLTRASQSYQYGLNLESVARIWRGGCIIRAALLEEIRSAYSRNPLLPNLLLDSSLNRAMSSRQVQLRNVVRTAIDLGIPTAGFMSALAYYDGYRSARLPANLTQAQRDYFGAHTYERIDEKGKFHTQWD